ncbi:hypothetical protein AAG906_013289 [Vitis piasezkii]
MMLSMAVQPNPNAALKSYTFPMSSNRNQRLMFKASNALSLYSTRSASTNLRLRASPAPVVAVAVSEQSSAPQESLSASPLDVEKLGVVVKPMEKPRLVLKFIWMEKNIGVALDQAIPGHGTIPLSPYYFWPRKDAWEEIKVLLESKPWISQKQMIILLNQATDIINLWQQSGGNLA